MRVLPPDKDSILKTFCDALVSAKVAAEPSAIKYSVWVQVVPVPIAT